MALLLAPAVIGNASDARYGPLDSDAAAFDLSLRLLLLFLVIGIHSRYNRRRAECLGSGLIGVGAVDSEEGREKE